jgi:hypothetical protein
MSDWIEYLASDELGRGEQVMAYAVGITVAVLVLAFFMLTVV